MKSNPTRGFRNKLIFFSDSQIQLDLQKAFLQTCLTPDNLRALTSGLGNDFNGFCTVIVTSTLKQNCIGD